MLIGELAKQPGGEKFNLTEFSKKNDEDSEDDESIKGKLVFGLRGRMPVQKLGTVWAASSLAAIRHGPILLGNF